MGSGMRSNFELPLRRVWPNGLVEPHGVGTSGKLREKAMDMILSQGVCAVLVVNKPQLPQLGLPGVPRRDVDLILGKGYVLLDRR